MKKSGSNEPNKYSAHSQPQKVTAFALIEQFRQEFKPNQVVVDVGCGTGEITVELCKYFKKTYAFDISKEAIDYANNTHKVNHLSINFFKADVTTFSLPEKVDWVFSANVLHWLNPTEQKKALTQMQSVLKDSGKLIITFGLRHEPLWSIIEASANSPPWSKYFLHFQNPRAFYTLDQYKKILLETGLEILNIQSKSIDYKFPNIQEFLNFVSSWLPHINLIPQEEKNNYMHFLGREYLSKRPAESNGSVSITFNVLETVAQRFMLSKKLNITDTNNSQDLLAQSHEHLSNIKP